MINNEPANTTSFSSTFFSNFFSLEATRDEIKTMSTLERLAFHRLRRRRNSNWCFEPTRRRRQRRWNSRWPWSNLGEADERKILSEIRTSQLLFSTEWAQMISMLTHCIKERLCAAIIVNFPFDFCELNAGPLGENRECHPLFHKLNQHERCFDLFEITLYLEALTWKKPRFGH